MSFLSIDIRKSLPGFVLDLKWEMQDEITVLFGPSGSGKTLTLQAIAGLMEPDEGVIRCRDSVLFMKNGKRPLSLPPQKRSIGYVFQGLALFPHMTVRGNIEYPLHEKTREERDTLVKSIIADLEISGLSDKYPAELSGGQAQRVALARALVRRPRLLLLDEPFSALHTPLRKRMCALLLDIHKHLGTPAVMVTHDSEEAALVADRVIDYGGRLSAGEEASALPSFAGVLRTAR